MEISQTWPDGHYKVTGSFFNLVQITGNKGVTKGVKDGIEIEYTSSGKNEVKIKYHYYGYDVEETASLSEKGCKWKCKGLMEYEMELVSDEEAEKIENDGDPIDAPACPYKIQPENLGKFIWIIGPPGAGKSTISALLARHNGYVFYEMDCFAFLRNPYIPAESDNPTMEQMNQRPLIGPGAKERQTMIGEFEQAWQKFKAGEGGIEGVTGFYEELSKDILRERTRIGGDFVVAGTVPTRELRNAVRSILGKEFYFIALEMDAEHQMERLRARHGEGSEVTEQMLREEFSFDQPASPDEDNTITVQITKGMSKDEVMQNVLETIENSINNN